MADKKERIMDLLKRGVITDDEALTLLEKAGLDTEDVKNGKSEKFTYTDKEGYENHDIDTGEAIKNSINTVVDKLTDAFRYVRKNVDDNVDFADGFPKVKKTYKTVERDIEGDFQAVKVDFSSAKLSIQPGDNAHVKIEYAIYGAIETDGLDDYLSSNTTLGVTDGVLTISSGVKRIGATIDLYLPEKNYEAVTLDIISGKLSAKSVRADKWSSKLIHGGIALSDLTTQGLKVENKNGSVSVVSSQTDKLELSSVNGEVKFDGSFVDGDVSLVNGTILLTQRDIRAQKLAAKNVHGEVKLAVPRDLGLAGHVRALFGGYKTRLDLDYPLEPGKNGAAVVRQGADSLTFELETKTGTVWLKDIE